MKKGYRKYKTSDVLLVSRFQWTRADAAELDEVMNYCKFFKRIKGNEGVYERDGKTCLVNGKWDVYHINTKELADFKNFLIKNNWLNNWFELMDRYKKYV